MSNEVFESNACKIRTDHEFKTLSTQSKRIEKVKTLPKCSAKIASQKVTLLKSCKIWTEFSTLKPRKIPERGGSWMILTNLLSPQLVPLLFLGFFVLQRNYQLLDPSAVFCRRSIHLLLSFWPQNYCRGKIWLWNGSSNTWLKWTRNVAVYKIRRE